MEFRIVFSKVKLVVPVVKDHSGIFGKPQFPNIDRVLHASGKSEESGILLQQCRQVDVIKPAHHVVQVPAHRPHRDNGVLKPQFTAQHFQIHVLDAGYNALEAHGAPQQGRDDIDLVAIGQAKQDIAVFGVNLAEYCRLGRIAVQETAIQFLRNLIDLLLVGFYNDDFVSLLDQLFGGYDR